MRRQSVGVPAVGTCALRGCAGRVGLHHALRALVRRGVAAVPRPAAGVAGTQGELARGHRRGTGAARPRGGGRVAPRDRQQPALRPAQRPDHVAVGHAPAVDGRGCHGRSGRRAGRGPRPEHRLGARRVVPGAGLPQRRPRGAGGRAPRPGPGRAARGRVRRPRRVRAARVRGRHLARAALRRQRPRHVHGALRRRQRAGGPLRPPAGRPPPRPSRPATVVDPRAAGELLGQPAPPPRLRLGVLQPLPVRAGLRLPGHLPDLLPPGPGGQQGGRRRAPGLPRHTGAVGGAGRRGAGRRQAVGPLRAAQGLRDRRRGGLRRWR